MLEIKVEKFLAGLRFDFGKFSLRVAGKGFHVGHTFLSVELPLRRRHLFDPLLQRWSSVVASSEVVLLVDETSRERQLCCRQSESFDGRLTVDALHLV